MKEKGSARERQVVALLIADGWVSWRTPGSLSPVDVWALKAGESPHAIQVKANKRSAFASFPPKERKALLALAAKTGAVPVLCWWPPYKDATFIYQEEWPESTRGMPDYIEDPATGCWLWQKGTVDGYGRCRRGDQIVMAHRWYYEQAQGPIPEGLELDHLCRVRACVNPDHLEPVTREENIRRTTITKLTREDVLAIRAALGTAQSIADQFGVSKPWVCKLRKGVGWGDAL
jgi:Holliday junction resolvase